MKITNIFGIRHLFNHIRYQPIGFIPINNISIGLITKNEIVTRVNLIMYLLFPISNFLVQRPKSGWDFQNLLEHYLPYFYICILILLLSRKKCNFCWSDLPASCPVWQFFIAQSSIPHVEICYFPWRCGIHLYLIQKIFLQWKIFQFFIFNTSLKNSILGKRKVNFLIKIFIFSLSIKKAYLPLWVSFWNFVALLWCINGAMNSPKYALLSLILWAI